MVFETIGWKSERRYSGEDHVLSSRPLPLLKTNKQTNGSVSKLIYGAVFSLKTITKVITATNQNKD